MNASETTVPAPSPARARWRGLLVALGVIVLFLSIPIGLVLWLFGQLPSFTDDGSLTVTERFYAGEKSARDKIAVVRIDGVLYEGLLGYFVKQIEQAAKDEQVKAVVLRINSPGGTVTASDHLFHRLVKLRDGDTLKKTKAKPIVVSMASLAASGGYYIAMPARTLYAERSTISGSIGVYAALPNAKELGDKIGLKMIVLKRGAVKDSGSPFHDMRPLDKAVWQDMIDHAYQQFLSVVEEGRPSLKGKLEEQVIDKTVTVRTREKDGEQVEQVRLTRYRADGGTFSADEALQLGLIDKIGHLEDAVLDAKQTASLGESYKVVVYDRPQTVLGSLLGIRTTTPGVEVDAARLANGLVPRLWFLAPQCELAGLAQTLASER